MTWSQERRSTCVTTTQLVAKQSQSVTQSHILHSQDVVKNKWGFLGLKSSIGAVRDLPLAISHSPVLILDHNLNSM